METGFIFVYFVFNKHLWGSCVQGIVPPTDLLFHLPGQPFHRDKIARTQAQQVQNKTHLAPKPVPPPVFLISVNDITLLPNVQAPTFGIILAFSPHCSHIAHPLSDMIIFPIHPFFPFNFSSNFLSDLLNYPLHDLDMDNSPFLPPTIYLLSRSTSSFLGKEKLFLFFLFSWIWRKEAVRSTLLQWSYDHDGEPCQKVELLQRKCTWSHSSEKDPNIVVYLLFPSPFQADPCNTAYYHSTIKF